MLVCTGNSGLACRVQLIRRDLLKSRAAFPAQEGMRLCWAVMNKPARYGPCVVPPVLLPAGETREEKRVLLRGVAWGQPDMFPQQGGSFQRVT